MSPDGTLAQGHGEAGKVMAGNGSIRASLVICTIILLSAAAYLASSVFAPLAFAVFILAIVWPLQTSLQAWLPKALALLLTLAITIVVF